jgi:hypothetical protein
MAETGTRARTPGGEHALRRGPGFRDLVVYGLLFIAPMVPVGVFGTLDARSHGAGWPAAGLVVPGIQERRGATAPPSAA